MTKLAPLLRDRLQATRFDDWRGTLSIRLQEDDASEEITLVIEDGGIQVVDGASASNTISGDQSISQLILGSESPDEVISVNGIEVTGSDSTDLVSVLFPAQYPQMENQAL